MEKKSFNQPKFSPETLAKEGIKTIAFIKKMEGMAIVAQSGLSLTQDQYEGYNTIIGHAQEATAHILAMFDAVGSLVNPTILH